MSERETLKSLATAMANPEKFKILSVLTDLGEMGATARDLARITETPVDQIGTILDELAALGMITAEGSRHGSAIYRIETDPTLSSDAAASLGSAQLHEISRSALRFFFEDATAAIAAGMLPHRSGQVEARVPALVDHRGWRDLAALYESVVAQIQATIDESEERLVEERGIRISSLLFLFETPDRKNTSGEDQGLDVDVRR